MIDITQLHLLLSGQQVSGSGRAVDGGKPGTMTVERTRNQGRLRRSSHSILFHRAMHRVVDFGRGNTRMAYADFTLRGVIKQFNLTLYTNTDLYAHVPAVLPDPAFLSRL